MYEENNNDPNNNMDDNENWEGRNSPEYPVPASPQPGCSRHFDFVENGHTDSLKSVTLTPEEISTLADNILLSINKLVEQINHSSIVAAIENNLKTGNNKLSLQDLLPANNQNHISPDDNRKTGQKRGNDGDICSVDMKKSRENPLPSSQIPSGFMVRNPIIDINNLQKSPLRLPPREMNKNDDKLNKPKNIYIQKYVNANHVYENVFLSGRDHNSAEIIDESDGTRQRDKTSSKQNKAEVMLPVTNSVTHSVTNILNTIPSRSNPQIPRATNRLAVGNIMSRADAQNLTKTTERTHGHLQITTVAKPCSVPTATVTSNAYNYPKVSSKYSPVGNSVVQTGHTSVRIKIPSNSVAGSTAGSSNSNSNSNIDKLIAVVDKRAPIAGKKMSTCRIKDQVDYYENLKQVKENLAQRREQLQNIEVKTAELNSVRDRNERIREIVVDHGHVNQLDVNMLPPLPPRKYFPAHLQPQQGLQPQANDPMVQPSTSANKVCEEIYQKLRAMFPDIDREYIKTYCPADWSPGMSHDIQFGNIVERILQNEASWIIDVTPNNFMIETAANNAVGATQNVDETYEYLTGIFPNADPHYLRSSAEKFKNENDVKAFVDDKLKTSDYPTREQYLAKIKITEEQQRYTKNFNVEHFLTLFPNPFSHFENDNRKCEFNLIVVEFLKNEFSRVRVTTINKLYRDCKYNMSLTAKSLRAITDFIMKPRCPSEIPTENIPMLQEMAFVRHQDEIRMHMETARKREEEEFNSLKTAGSLWTCQCCYDDECMPSKCSTCDNAHVFCNSCVVNGTDSRLGDGETHVPCFLNCGSEFSISTLQKVLPPTKFSILLKKRQAAEVMAAGLEGLVSCPFCHFASIPPEGDKVFKCLNPECMKESCIQCKEPNHVPFRCGEQDKKDKARKYIEEKMTQALTRTCYQCKRAFFKEEGCNKMTCPCGAMMCYICNQPVNSYNHFRGQGSNEVNKCPLWTDNQRLNAETVRKVEEDARREVLRQDPTLDIGTTGLAPALPPPAAGPHRDIPNTDNLANILAARVLNADRFDFEGRENPNRQPKRN
ncbi:uncharacterized protein LOC130670913 isoform X2 [Microplitis mediator]|nr:uncharacterized protein LOC130670913 isoform X2 [Microplitis mediator]